MKIYSIFFREFHFHKNLSHLYSVTYIVSLHVNKYLIPYLKVPWAPTCGTTSVPYIENNFHLPHVKNIKSHMWKYLQPLHVEENSNLTLERTFSLHMWKSFQSHEHFLYWIYNMRAAAMSQTHQLFSISLLRCPSNKANCSMLFSTLTVHSDFINL